MFKLACFTVAFLSVFYTREQQEAAAALMELQIWYYQPLPGGMPGCILNPVFRTNLLTALIGG